MPQLAPSLPLLHGAAIPQLGLGTWPLDDAEAERIVADAIDSGYRHVDTAERYGNEVGVGRGIRAAGVPRDHIFVTTKFDRHRHSVDGVEAAWKDSTQKLGVDYLDLLLIHWPNPDYDRYVEAWQGLTRLLDSHRVRAIGVSNFKPSHLDRIIDATGVVPDVNQIQVNPHVLRRPARRYGEKHGIVTVAYSPLGKGGDLLREAVVIETAFRHGCSPAQILLRWSIQHGMVAIPKSADPKRLDENLNIFEFALTDDEMAAIDNLDQGEDAGSDSDRVGH